MSSLDEPSPSPSPSASSPTEMDPLLKDLREKKLSFRRNLASLAAELKELRARLSSLEHSLATETSARLEAETKAKNMEEEMSRLQECLDESNMQLKASAPSAEKYLKELDDLRSQLLAAQATAQSAQLQCSQLLKELDEKNSLLVEHENLISRLGRLIDDLQKDDLVGSTSSDANRKQVKDEVLRIEHGRMQAAGQSSKEDCEMTKLDEFSRDGGEFESIVSQVMAKLLLGRETSMLMSAQWKLNSNAIAIANDDAWRCKMMWKCYWTCCLLWRLIYLFFFLQILGLRFISYLLIQAIQLLLKLIFVEPLRFCLFILRTICMQNVLYFHFYHC